MAKPRQTPSPLHRSIKTGMKCTSTPSQLNQGFHPWRILAGIGIALILNVDPATSPCTRPAAALHDAIPCADLNGFRWIPYPTPWLSRRWRC